jgi:AcrR family transcriptional regulator
MDGEMTTQEKVLYFGKQEFLQKGFQNASLRNIASAAGMTTGAIYTYFQDKNALFEAIVDPVCLQMEEKFAQLSVPYYRTGCMGSEISTQQKVSDLHFVYDYIYDNFDTFRLLVVGAEGSSRADFVHSLVDRVVVRILAYLDPVLVEKKLSSRASESIVHLVSWSYFNALLEPVRHDMSYEEAIENLDFLATFYTGGWQNAFCGLFCGMEKTCQTSMMRGL